MVTASVDAGALTAGDYILTLGGTTKGRVAEIVDEYYFCVRR